MIKLKSMSLQRLEGFFLSIGEQKFRAKQVFSWLHKGVESFDEMTTLSKELREKLTELCDVEVLQTQQIQVSKKDGTQKYLFALEDGQSIESVLMKYKYGNTICISSQAGCRMNCQFCASCQGGLIRNLTSGEMLDQILRINRASGEKINHVVVMGVGEPFDNYENLIQFLKIINDENGMNMSLRNITVSTCGVVPRMADFSKDMPQVTLAVSLHAPNDAIRDALMPINRKYNMETLLNACRSYTGITNKRITFEYILIEGVNDSKKQAEELAGKLKGILCHVNLIPFNGVKGSQYKSSSFRTCEEFRGVLENRKIEATIRRELGSDIEGACGQLRSKQKNTDEKK